MPSAFILGWESRQDPHNKTKAKYDYYHQELFEIFFIFLSWKRICGYVEKKKVENSQKGLVRMGIFGFGFVVAPSCA
jgi:hypothetical protein